MEFNCQSLPLNNIPIGAMSVKEPLCNKCVQTECTNPIKTHAISIMGIPTKWRLWTVNNVIRQVVQCIGFVETYADEKEEEEDVDEKDNI